MDDDVEEAKLLTLRQEEDVCPHENSGSKVRSNERQRGYWELCPTSQFQNSNYLVKY